MHAWFKPDSLPGRMIARLRRLTDAPQADSSSRRGTNSRMDCDLGRMMTC